MMNLRDYQQPKVEQVSQILMDKGICLMAFECRTGKTISSLFAAHNVGAKSVLFVTPKKAIPSIQHDYDAMKADNPYLFSISITNPESILASFKKAEKLAFDIVCNKYPTVSRKGIKFKGLLSVEKDRQLSLLLPYLAEGIDTIIVDECHRLSAFPRPSGAQECIRKMAKGKKVLLLSGTPNPESHSMFFHEFQISERTPWAQYKNFYAWAKDGYVNIKDKMVNGLKVTDYSEGNKDRILRDISGYTVTLTQQEAGFETNIDERTLFVQMTDKTAKLIRDLKRNRVVGISRIPLEQTRRPADGSNNPTELIAETPADLLNKIHQLAGGTIKIDDGYYIVDRSKAEYLASTFRNRHYCVFYSYKAERDLLKAILGSKVTEDWQEFQATPDSIFIGQIRSVREGIRLDTAEFSVFYSMEYSYVSYAQGINRIVSKERSNASKIYFLTSQCKIEQMILDCVHNKKDFTLSVYNNKQ